MEDDLIVLAHSFACNVLHLSLLRYSSSLAVSIQIR